MDICMQDMRKHFKFILIFFSAITLLLTLHTFEISSEQTTTTITDTIKFPVKVSTIPISLCFLIGFHYCHIR